MNLFKKKKEIKGRYENYYEGIMKTNRRLIGVVLFLCFLLLFAINVARKPPVVIPVFSDGSFDVIKDYRTRTNITEESIRFFSETFVRNLNLTDSYGMKEKLPIALGMMSADLQSKYRRDALSSDLLKERRALGWISKTKIADTKISRSGPIIKSEVNFARKIEDTKNDLKFALNHKIEMRIKVLPEPTNDYPLQLQVIAFDMRKVE